MGTYAPAGFRTVTGYPVVKDAPAFIEFLKQVFDAEETFRTVGGAGGIHAEMRIGDSRLMLGGGGPDLRWQGDVRPMAFHIAVRNCDGTYQRAMTAGATSFSEPQDQFWGERTANIKDPFGNFWYIGTHQGESFTFPGMPVLQPYLHPVKADPLIDFMKRAFDAQEDGRVTTDTGRMEHATITFGDATVEVTEAQGPYQPMPSMFYAYVPDVDRAYARAMEAGAASLSLPADQSYGDRTAAVTDVCENRWYLATHRSEK